MRSRDTLFTLKKTLLQVLSYLSLTIIPAVAVVAADKFLLGQLPFYYRYPGWLFCLLAGFAVGLGVSVFLLSAIERLRQVIGYPPFHEITKAEEERQADAELARNQIHYDIFFRRSPDERAFEEHQVSIFQLRQLTKINRKLGILAALLAALIVMAFLLLYTLNLH